MQQNQNILPNSLISLPTQQYPNRQFQIIKLLGQGGEGIVYFAQPLNWGINQNQVALKFQTEMSESQLNFIDLLINYQNQESKLTSNQKSQIVRVFERTHYQQKYVLIMEVGDLDLYSFMLISLGKINILKRIQILKEITQPIKFLHFNNMFHRDIKPENYLKVGEEFKLIDFGLVKKKIQGQKIQTQYVGSPLFQAPEIAQGGDSYSQEIDIWSLGITFYEVLTNQQYKPNQQNFEFQTTPEIPLSQSLEQALQNLLSGMLKQQPQERYNIIKVSQELISLENQIMSDQMKQNKQQIKAQDTTPKSPKRIFPPQNPLQGFPQNSVQNQVPGFPQNPVPNQVPPLQGFPQNSVQNQVPGFAQNPLQGFPQNPVPNQVPPLQGFSQNPIPSQVPGCSQSQVLGFPQNQVPGFPQNQLQLSLGQNQINPQQNNQLFMDIQKVFSEEFQKEFNKISSELKEQFLLNQQFNQSLQSEILKIQQNQTEFIELKNFIQIGFKNLEQPNQTQKNSQQDNQLIYQQLWEQQNNFIVELKKEMKENNFMFLNDLKNIQLENSNKEIQQINNQQISLNEIIQCLKILNKEICEKQQLEYNKEITQIINQQDQLNRIIQQLNKEISEQKQFDNGNTENFEFIKNQLGQFNQSIQQLNISNQDIIQKKQFEIRNEEISQIKIQQEQLDQIQQLTLKNNDQNEKNYEQITKILGNLKAESLQTKNNRENMVQFNEDHQFNQIQNNQGNSIQKQYFENTQISKIEKLSQKEEVEDKNQKTESSNKVQSKNQQNDEKKKTSNKNTRPGSPNVIFIENKTTSKVFKKR